MSKHISREPVVWTSAITAILDCLILFGLDLTTQQEASLMIAITAVMSIFARGVVNNNVATALATVPPGYRLDQPPSTLDSVSTIKCALPGCDEVMPIEEWPSHRHS